MILESTRKATKEELIQRIEELQKENYEIRQWKYVIDNPIDLDKLKELDLIKIKGKKYIAEDIIEEIRNKLAVMDMYNVQDAIEELEKFLYEN